MSPPKPHPIICDLIGRTPLVALEFSDPGLTIHAKCEFLNPSGSIKDRFARAVIEDAEKRGALRPDSIILECSSGNTGVALAMMGAAKGYAVEIVLSDRASKERRMLIERLGAKVILYDGRESYSVGIELTRRMAAGNPRYFLPRQFENPLNARDHAETTAQEIISQLARPADAFVSGYGTGGTLSGVSRALRERYPGVKVFAMEPAAPEMLPEECAGHCIEGVSQGFLPPLMHGVPLDGACDVTAREATAMARRLMADFGLLVGTSSGANVVAALRIAGRLDGGTVVTVLCDRAERYFSTRLFTDDARPAVARP